MSDRLSDRLLTARELGEYFRLKPKTILRMWERHELPGHKIGRAVRFDLDEVLAATRRELGATGGNAPSDPPQRPEAGYMVGLPSETTRRKRDA